MPRRVGGSRWAILGRPRRAPSPTRQAKQEPTPTPMPDAVRPAIREGQAAGAKTLRKIAAALKCARHRWREAGDGRRQQCATAVDEGGCRQSRLRACWRSARRRAAIESVCETFVLGEPRATAARCASMPRSDLPCSPGADPVWATSGFDMATTLSSTFSVYGYTSHSLRP